MRRPSMIKFGKKQYPIICDLNVLEVLQDKYGSVNNFERKLLGLVIQRNEKGEIIYKDDGDPLMLLMEPSIDAIETALLAMVKEGERVSGYLDGKEDVDFTDEIVILNECTIPFEKMARILHEEYKKCFETKKS